MIDHNTPVTEDELHAYVDGELPADRREAVEAWLASHPDDAARVAAWRAQAEAIRARYGSVVNEPVPERLTLEPHHAQPALLGRDRGGGGGRGLRRSAASPAGWRAARRPRRRAQVELFTTEALGAHRLYIGEVRHPIEVKAEEDHLLPWLSRRVGTTLRAPDLGAFGLKLLGGRLLPGVGGPAALFMYEGAQRRALHDLLLASSTRRAPRSATTTNDNFGAVHWIEGSYGWVVSGPKDKDAAEGRRQRGLRAARQRARRRRAGRAPNQLMSRRGS